MPRSQIIRWDNPAAGGLMTGTDPRQLPPQGALICKNADFSALGGGVAKSPGFGIHALSWPSQFLAKPIIGLGYFIYTKVWNENTPPVKINQRKGLLIAQSTGDAAKFYYYLREYDFGVGTWGVWQGKDLTSPLEPFEELDYGETELNDLVNWRQFSDLALRGGAGAAENATPLWLGYVNRNANDDNGFFHDYVTQSINNLIVTDGGDMDGFIGTQLGIDLPKIVNEQGPYFGWGWADLIHFNPGSIVNQTIMATFLPEYDGYQIADFNSVVGHGSMHERFVFFRIQTSNDSYVINSYFYIMENIIPKRLTAINFYYSTKEISLYGIQGAWSEWKLAKRVDIRGGVQYPICSEEGTWQAEFSRLNITAGNLLSEDIFNAYTIFIRFENGTVESYLIDDWFPYSEGWVYIYITPCATTQLVNGIVYNFEIYEKWYKVGELFILPLMIFGNEQGIAPAWLPNPENIIAVINGTEKQIEIKHNYKHQIEFQDRHIIAPVYNAFTNAFMPLRGAYSDPKLTDWGGFDITHNWFDLPAFANDEINGFAAELNILSIFTKYRLFRAAFEPIFTLREQHFDLGLVAPKSLVYHKPEGGAGAYWFLGRRKNQISVYRYDGLNNFADVGINFKAELLAALNADGAEPERAIGWWDAITNQYRLSISSYYQGT